MNSNLVKNIVKVFSFLFVASVLSSCSLQKSVAISSTGSKTNVSGGVLHPATNEPVSIGITPNGK